MKKDATKILKRYEGNPIINVDDYPGIAQIYNPMPIQYGDETILLLSIVEHAGNKGHYGTCIGQTRVARSKDGIHFEIEDNKIHNVSFVGGCNGNLQGISHLVEGMDVDEAISRLEGIQCGFKTTSCPDQLAKALKEAVNK